jgi:hypothetical protein
MEKLPVAFAEFILGLITNMKLGWGATRSFLLAQLKGEFLKLVLKKVLGSSVAGGFRGWIVRLLAKELYEELGEPLIKAVLRKGNYEYNVVKGKLLIKKLEEVGEGNDQEYDDIVDDIFR